MIFFFVTSDVTPYSAHFVNFFVVLLMVSSANSSARLLRGSTPSSHQLQDFRESSDCVWTRWETETLLDEVKAQKGAHSDDLNWEAIAAKVGHGKTPAVRNRCSKHCTKINETYLCIFLLQKCYRTAMTGTLS
jgi:hypothetical protein